MAKFKVLKNQKYTFNEYSIVPIRMEDRYDIMKWRNEQLYHLRQLNLLTSIDQDNYFKNVVNKLFEQDKPNQLLFSFLKDEICIGYGGLVHINWVDMNAEISFIMNTSLEHENFAEIWSIYLRLIDKVAFEDLILHKIFTYAFDLRPHLYPVLESNGFNLEAVLIEHSLYQGKMLDVFIHSKFNNRIFLDKATLDDCLLTYSWANLKEIRKFSFNHEFISLDDHKNWFTHKIESSLCDYFILKKGNGAIGSIRIDYNDRRNEGIISYLIDPRFQGKGFGKKILLLLEKELSDNLPDNSFTIVGFVQKLNIASRRIFEKLDYQIYEEVDDVFKFVKKILK